MSERITIAQLTLIAGVKPRALKKALLAIVSGKRRTWRGAALVIAQVHGRGGRSGWSYEVRLDSLPEPLQAAFKALRKPVQLALPLGDREARHARWWTAHVAPALAAPKRSNARGAAIKALAGKSVVGPDGEFFTPSLRDVQRKVAMLDRHAGEAGFIRKPRKGKGQKVVKVSRTWDRVTADLPEEQRAAIVIKVDRFVKSLWGNGVTYSVVRRLSSEHLAHLTRDAGCTLLPSQLVPACALPKHYLEARRDFRRVHEFRTDAKAYDDSRARVMLTSASLAAMELVYGDVHHFDVLLLRSDGSEATPKGIAWLDAANRRVRIDLVLCEPGTAIRNEDLIRSFVKMTQDPHWGLPKRLYLDNGSEYGFAKLLEATMKLAALGCEIVEWNNPVIRAQPYNAAAKGILEGSFRIIEQQIIAPLQGSLNGPNLMKKKSANLGKAPVPFGNFDTFALTFPGLMHYFNTNPQQGELKGLSPNQKFAQQIEAGWKPITIEEGEAWLLFSRRDYSTVVKGAIKIDGVRYYHDALFRYEGRKVGVQVPEYVKWPAVPVYTPEGDHLCIARLETAFRRDDPEGAVESGRRKRANRQTIAELARDVDPLDVPNLMIASAERQPSLPEPRGTEQLRLSDTSAKIGRAITGTVAEPSKHQPSAKQKAQIARVAMLKSRGYA